MVRMSQIKQNNASVSEDRRHLRHSASPLGQGSTTRSDSWQGDSAHASTSCVRPKLPQPSLLYTHSLRTDLGEMNPVMQMDCCNCRRGFSTAPIPAHLTCAPAHLDHPSARKPSSRPAASALAPSPRLS